VPPEPLSDNGETFPGGTIAGNQCISVPTEQLEGATIRVEATFSIRGDRTFFGLS
jgi:hypothetical protein